MKLLIAMGGNALTHEDQDGTYEQLCENALAAARRIVALRTEGGHEVLITHGNGPQIGAGALQHLAAEPTVPAMPMHVLGAMAQGEIGYLLQQAIGWVDPGIRTATILTRVVVRADDPEFSAPTKPIGPFYSPEEARRLAAERGWTVGADAGRGWRRMVPSPRPHEIIEIAAVRALAEWGVMVIAAGGGGIPVARSSGPGEGALNGVEAVVDKDRCAALLAAEVGVDMLVLLTHVPRVAIDFGTPRQRDVARLVVSDARRHLDEGHFPTGSMGPKMESAIEFVENSGHAAVIASPEHLGEAVAGRQGSWIVADTDGPSRLLEPAGVA